jgi:hypothetical protein
MRRALHAFQIEPRTIVRIECDNPSGVAQGVSFKRLPQACFRASWRVPVQAVTEIDDGNPNGPETGEKRGGGSIRDHDLDAFALHPGRKLAWRSNVAQRGASTEARERRQIAAPFAITDGHRSLYSLSAPMKDDLREERVNGQRETTYEANTH